MSAVSVFITVSTRRAVVIAALATALTTAQMVQRFYDSAHHMLQCVVYSTIIMEALRVRERVENWNDDRLDELSGRVDAGFAKIDQEIKAGFAQVNSSMKEGFAAVDKRLDKIDVRFEKVDARFEKVDKRFEKVDERFERLYRLLFVSAISIVGILIAALIAH